MKLALFPFNVKLMLQEAFEDLANMADIAFQGWLINWDVVSINNDKCTQHILENIIN